MKSGGTPEPVRLASLRGGQALVEFSLLIPILLVMLVGAVDFGRAFYAVTSVANAAREAAYYASQNAGTGAGLPPNNGVCASPYTSVRSVVVNELQSLPVTGSNPTVTCTTGNDGQTYTFVAQPTCTTAGTTPTCAGGSCGGGNTCTQNFRYVDVTVVYRFTMLGPYGPFVPAYDIQRTVRMRVRP